MPSGCHPVRGQPNLANVFNRGRSDIGHRLAYGHAPGRWRIEHRQWGALAHRHCLATASRKTTRCNSNIAYRYLPGPYKLIAHAKATDSAITNMNKKGFIGDRRNS